MSEQFTVMLGFVILFVLPCLFAFLRTIKFCWHEFPVSITALAWMAAVEVLIGIHKFAYFGKTNWCQLLLIVMPVVNTMLLCYLDQFRQCAEKNHT